MKLGDVVWERREHSLRLSLSGDLGASISWSVLNEDHKNGTPYTVSALGKHLRRRFKTEDEAKVYAEWYCRRVLTDSLKKLGVLLPLDDPQPAKKEDERA